MSQNTPEQHFNPVHSFDVSDALKYGSIEKALIIKEIRGMQVYKLRNGGQGWVYYSGAALCQKFPYMKRRSITQWIDELVRDGHLETEVRNNVSYDRTKSYRLPDITEVDVADSPIGKNRQWNGENGQSIGKNEKSIGENGQPIPSLTTSPTTSLKRIYKKTGETAAEDNRGQYSETSSILGQLIKQYGPAEASKRFKAMKRGEIVETGKDPSLTQTPVKTPVKTFIEHTTADTNLPNYSKQFPQTSASAQSGMFAAG